MKDTGKINLEAMKSARFYNKWLFSFLKPHLKGKTLEIGAGIGTFVSMFKNKKDIHAIDIEKDYIKTLKKILGPKNAGTGDIEKGRFFFGENQKFDSIYTLNVFEHIKNDQQALKNTFKLLKKGGKFVILVPAHPVLYGPIDKPLGHYRRYTKKSLSKKLREAGFEVEDSFYLNALSAIGWFGSGKILRRKYITQSHLGIFKLISRPFLWLEKVIKMPFGLSVVAVCTKK